MESIPQFQPFCAFNEELLYSGIQFSVENDKDKVEILIQCFMSLICNTHSNSIASENYNENKISVKSAKDFLLKNHGKSIKTPLIIIFNDKKYFLNGKFSGIESELNFDIQEDVIYGSVIGIFRMNRKVTILSNKVKYIILYDVHNHIKDLIELFSNEQLSTFNVGIEMNAKQKKIYTLHGISLTLHQ